MAQRSKPLLGQLLIQHGLITREQLEEALLRQRSTFKYIGEILIDMGALNRRDLMRMLELQHQLSQEPVADSESEPPSS
jgi:hypothetical protein